MRTGDIKRPSDDEAIEATAAAWLAQSDGGLTKEETAEFVCWRTADPRHEAAVVRLEGAWSSLQQLRDFRPLAARHPDVDLLQGRPEYRYRRSRLPAFATVALAASIMFAAVWWLAGTTRAAAQQRYATTADGYERMILEDGSLLELNANSEVIVRFTTAQRRVRLERGEAHFTVAKNPLRPFLVEAGTVAVRAIGTAFNVRLGVSDVEVLVTEGRVGVVSERERVVQSVPSPSSPPAPEQRLPVLLLAANERALISTVRAIPSTVLTAPVVEKVAPDVVRAMLAWQGPRLTFSDTPLAEAIAQFNRHNQVQIELADAELGALPIGGSFRPDNVDAFVRLLTADNDIAEDRPDARRIVLRRRK
jgi:transmembrane sensor